jgi:2,3-bisphosphoglycerate-independent phosphoglycerate mutase
VKLGSISGRYFAMDRDKNFDRVQKAYDALVGQAELSFSNPVEFIKENYAKGVNDEFIVPALNSSYDKNEVALQDNDSFIFFNFRPDRAREISHLIFDSNLYDYQTKNKKNNIYFVTMMKYDGITPSAVAFAPQQIKNGLGETLANNKVRQLRVAETEKYAHVTFFFDGGEDIDYAYENKIIVESAKNISYDEVPQMGAYEICEHIINKMDNNDVIIANFANGDMVGHTGNFEATIKAVEIVDECIGKIYEAAQIHGYTLMITADHGNADKMLDENDEVVTSHTSNKVPFIVTDKNISLKENGKLANVAPTMLKYINVDVPDEMEESLIN